MLESHLFPSLCEPWTLFDPLLSRDLSSTVVFSLAHTLSFQWQGPLQKPWEPLLSSPHSPSLFPQTQAASPRASISSPELRWVASFPPILPAALRPGSWLHTVSWGLTRSSQGLQPSAACCPVRCLPCSLLGCPCSQQEVFPGTLISPQWTCKSSLGRFRREQD